MWSILCDPRCVHNNQITLALCACRPEHAIIVRYSVAKIVATGNTLALGLAVVERAEDFASYGLVVGRAPLVIGANLLPVHWHCLAARRSVTCGSVSGARRTAALVHKIASGTRQGSACGPRLGRGWGCRSRWRHLGCWRWRPCRGRWRGRCCCAHPLVHIMWSILCDHSCVQNNEITLALCACRPEHAIIVRYSVAKITATGNTLAQGLAVVERAEDFASYGLVVGSAPLVIGANLLPVHRHCLAARRSVTCGSVSGARRSAALVHKLASGTRKGSARGPRLGRGWGCRSRRWRPGHLPTCAKHVHDNPNQAKSRHGAGAESFGEAVGSTNQRWLLELQAQDKTRQD